MQEPNLASIVLSTILLLGAQLWQQRNQQHLRNRPAKPLRRQLHPRNRPQSRGRRASKLAGSGFWTERGAVTCLAFVFLPRHPEGVMSPMVRQAHHEAVKPLKTLDLILSLSKDGATDHALLQAARSPSVDRVTHRSDAGDFALHHISRLQPFRRGAPHADA